MKMKITHGNDHPMWDYEGGPRGEKYWKTASLKNLAKGNMNTRFRALADAKAEIIALHYRHEGVINVIKEMENLLNGMHDTVMELEDIVNDTIEEMKGE